MLGQWMLKELRSHGYDVSPRILYPILHRMEKLGWLRCEVDPSGGARAMRRYFLEKEGTTVLDIVKRQLAELNGELGCRAGGKAANRISYLTIGVAAFHAIFPLILTFSSRQG